MQRSSSLPERAMVAPKSNSIAAILSRCLTRALQVRPSKVSLTVQIERLGLGCQSGPGSAELQASYSRQTLCWRKNRLRSLH